MYRILTLLLSWIFLHCIFSYSYSTNLPWEIITNLNDSKEILILNDTLYAASTGGFIIIPILEEKHDSRTAEHGLTNHHFNSIGYSEKDMIILGSLTGSIAFYDKIQGGFREDYNLEGHEITSVFVISDTLWITSKDLVAVYLFNINKKVFEFRDFYSNFPVKFNLIEQIFYKDNDIWVATDNGLLNAPGDFLKFNLKSVDSWKVITTENGLASNSIYSLAENGDTLLIGTSNGLSKYYHNTFLTINAGLNGRSIRNIKVKNSTIWVNNSRAIYRLDGNSFIPLYYSTLTDINDFDLDNRNGIWVSLNEKGLRNVSEEKKIWFNGPIDNTLGTIYMDNRRRLWVLTGIFGDQRTKGFSVLGEDNIWRNYRHIGNWRPTASAQTILEDLGGNIWIGSWNGGLTIIDPEFSFYHFNNYATPGELWISSITQDDTLQFGPPDSVKHFLSYTQGHPDLLVVTDMTMDIERQSIWLTTLAVNSGKPLVRYVFPEFSEAAFDSLNWQKTALGSNIGIRGTELASITLDVFNNPWIGMQKDGVVTMQFNQTGGYDWYSYNENDYLKNNACLSVAGDQDGYVWLGTMAGLNAYLNGMIFDFREDYQPIGLQINDIFIDNQNNKWIATDKGLSLLKASGSPWDVNSWIHIVPMRSELLGSNIYHTNLPSQVIRSVYVDDKTGDVYCSTLSGLAILRNNPFTTPLPDLEKVTVGPVPFLINDQNNMLLYFRNLTGNSEVKILTASGRLVRTLSNTDRQEILGSLAQWNGRNERGELISSGVYIYLITDETGNSTSGKFMVIRE
jgi:ligand-binding sensor domain-containing protein